MLFHWLLYLVVISELSVVMDDVWNLQCLHACMVSRELWQLWQDNNVYVLALLMTLMVTMPARVPWELCSWSCYCMSPRRLQREHAVHDPPSGVVLARSLQPSYDANTAPLGVAFVGGTATAWVHVVSNASMVPRELCPSSYAVLWPSLAWILNCGRITTSRPVNDLDVVRLLWATTRRRRGR